jgi:hypothetical protein
MGLIGIEEKSPGLVIIEKISGALNIITGAWSECHGPFVRRI